MLLPFQVVLPFVWMSQDPQSSSKGSMRLNGHKSCRVLETEAIVYSPALSTPTIDKGTCVSATHGPSARRYAQITIGNKGHEHASRK